MPASIAAAADSPRALILSRWRRLASEVEHDAVDLGDFVGEPAGDPGKHGSWDSLGFRLASLRADARRGNHVTLSHPDAWRISQALIASGVIGDYRTPDKLRLGPVPISTRFCDVWDTLYRLSQIAADKSYEAMPTQISRVT